MKRFGAVAALWIVFAGTPGVTAAATCPIGVPVVNLPHGPHPSGFNWSAPILPAGDPCVAGITVDPTNEKIWYVSGPKGLYITRDGGVHWEHHNLAGAAMGQTVVLAPGNPAEVYAGTGKTLFGSANKGVTWKLLRTFEREIYSVLAAPGGRIYVGPAWGDSPTPNGIFFSPDKGAHWQALPFGAGVKGLICWDVERDPNDGTLYVATEIADHTKPGHPPLFRSQNGGQTWTNVAGTLPTHVIALELRPADGYIYALTEGAGLYGSANHGAAWIPPTLIAGPTGSLLMNRKSPLKLYGGQQKHQQLNGGAFVSVNAGKVFHPIGLAGATIGGFSLSGTGTRLYAAAYGSGVYVSPVPASLQP